MILNRGQNSSGKGRIGADPGCFCHLEHLRMCCYDAHHGSDLHFLVLLKWTTEALKESFPCPTSRNNAVCSDLLGNLIVTIATSFTWNLSFS